MTMMDWSVERDHGFIVLWSRLVCYPCSSLFWRWRAAAHYLEVSDRIRGEVLVTRSRLVRYH